MITYITSFLVYVLQQQNPKQTVPLPIYEVPASIWNREITGNWTLLPEHGELDTNVQKILESIWVKNEEEDAAINETQENEQQRNEVTFKTEIVPKSAKIITLLHI